jgi:hypothetical protein
MSSSTTSRARRVSRRLIASSALESAVSTRPAISPEAILERVEIVVEMTFHGSNLEASGRVREDADQPNRPVM